MPIEFKEKICIFSGICSIEEAESFLEWLLVTEESEIDLSQCEHIHTAILQAILAVKPKIKGNFQNPSLASWLNVTLANHRNLGN